MTTLFNGWMGYGTALQAGSLLEPTDPSYLRRSFILGDVDYGIVNDVGSGTVGPATTAWGSIGFAALFDAQVGGNLLLWFPLSVPLIIQAGGTITSGPGATRLFFADLQGSQRTSLVWPAGSAVARTFDGRVLTAGVALQVTSGQLAAETVSFGNNVTMAVLPTAQPASGTGQLWNNGGIIAVS
ncbi:MAG: phage tail fiber protein [Janthinobacterium lividum]